MSNVNSTVKNIVVVAPKADIHVGGTSYRLPRAALARAAKSAAQSAG